MGHGQFRLTVEQFGELEPQLPCGTRNEPGVAVGILGESLSQQHGMKRGGVTAVPNAEKCIPKI